MRGVSVFQAIEHANHIQVWTDTGIKWVPKDTSNIDYLELVERLEQEEFAIVKAESDIPFTALFAPN